VAFSWHLQSDWKFDPNPERASEVEIRFFAEGAQKTRVELEHRELERHGGLRAIAHGGGFAWRVECDFAAICEDGGRGDALDLKA
jgi:hypothetical protein